MSARVAYICADGGVPVFGAKGASVHVQEVVRALERAGAHVEIFAARCGDGGASLDGVPCHVLPHATANDPAQRERQAMAVDGVLQQMLDERGPFDMVYERYSLWSTSAMQHARRHAIPGLLEVNAPLIEEQASHRTLVDRASAERCRARVFEAASAVLAVSTPVADYVRAFVEGAKVQVVPNGVDPARFSPAVPPSLPAPPGVLTLGFVGSMKRWHGIDVLFTAFARVHETIPSSRLLIIGDGPERARLDAALGDAVSVILTGAVPPTAVPRLLTSMDVAAAPYHAHGDFYFSPLKLFEYMAAGLPVVASGLGQISEVIDDGRTGVLCVPGDAEAVAASVLELFADPVRRRRIGDAARRRVCTAHTWDAVASRILDIAASSRETDRAAVEVP